MQHYIDWKAPRELKMYYCNSTPYFYFIILDKNWVKFQNLR